MMFDLAVLIGRFQPFHRGHEALINQGLLLAPRMVIVVGSVGIAPSLRNPWSFEERVQMISAVVPVGRVDYTAVYDSAYDVDDWVRRVHAGVGHNVPPGGRVVLIGHEKDASSFYLKCFPDWEYMAFPLLEDGVGATAIRETYFGPNQSLPSGVMAPSVLRFLEGWRTTPLYERLRGEYTIAHGRIRPVQADGLVHEELVVLVCAGRVRLSRNESAPGCGLLRIPGADVPSGEKGDAVRWSLLLDLCGNSAPGVRCVGQKEFSGPGRDPVYSVVSMVSVHVVDGESALLRGCGWCKAVFEDFLLSEIDENRHVFFEDHGRILANLINNDVLASGFGRGI